MASSLMTSALTVDEFSGTATLTFSLLTAAAGSTSFAYSLNGLMAYESIGNYGDFWGNDGTVTFSAGQRSQSITFNLNNDATVEPTESLYLWLSNASNLTLGNNQVLVSIVDNDRVVADWDGNGTLSGTEKAQLCVRDVAVDEKAGSATFDLVLDKATTGSFSVVYGTADGTAHAGEDFIAKTGSVTFAAGQTVQHVTVSLTDDVTSENAEFFHLTLQSPPSGSASNQVVIADAQGTAVIGRNDAGGISTPTVLCSPIVVSEGEGYGEFTVQLSSPSLSTVAVDYNVGGLTAYESVGNSGDFCGYAGTLQFAAGITTQTVRFELNPGQNSVEAMESLVLSLSNPSGVAIANTQVLGTVVDDDNVVGDTNGNGTLDGTEQAQLSIRDVVVDEGAGLATFDLILDRATTEAFTVAYSTATQPGSASAGVDFTYAIGSVGFAAGQTVQHITVGINNDSATEGNEFFNLTLGALGGRGAAQVQVVDARGQGLIGANDANALSTPTLTCSALLVDESQGYGEFTLQLNAPSNAWSPITVNYDVNGLMAYESVGDAGDFAGYPGTVSFAPGTTTQTVRFEINPGTNVAEDMESLYLSLSNAGDSNTVNFANNRVMATIVDNDTVVGDTNASGLLDANEKANLSVRDVVVDEKSGLATFDLVLDKATTDSFSVAYSTATAPGTATAGMDFIAASGSVSFGAGQTVQHVSVHVLDDNLAESNEFFNLTLGSLGGHAANQVQKADATGAACIGANDQIVSSQPKLMVHDAVAIEDEGYADVLVQLSAPASGNVSVNYDFAGLSAYESIGASGDFSAVDGTLVFRAGETSKTLRVELNNQNSSTEPAIETVAITLSNAVGASIADANATLILADDDALSSSNPMAYGLSHDTYVVDGHNDRVLETTYGGRDQVNSLITYTLAANVENLLLQGSQGLAGTGNELANILTGNGGANTLTGLAGQDTLIGGAGNDKLVGGADRDVLTGGSGSDIFDFNALSESGLTTAARDVITDFTHGADRIDVSTLDARAATAGNEAFSFIGHASFGTNASGQLRFDYNATTHVATLYASTDADSAAEFSLQVTLANATALVASDFIL